MRHIRYLSSKETLCWRPDLLGEDFVTLDPLPEDTGRCKECLALLMAHNKAAYEAEQSLSFDYNSHRHESEVNQESMDWALWALVVVVSAFWNVLYLGLWMAYCG